MARWISLLTVVFGTLGLPSTRPAAGETKRQAPMAPNAFACSAAQDECSARPSIVPPLACPICSAAEALTRQLEQAQAAVCTTMAIVPLLPQLPACETRPVEHAANDTRARL